MQLEKTFNRNLNLISNYTLGWIHEVKIAYLAASFSRHFSLYAYDANLNMLHA